MGARTRAQALLSEGIDRTAARERRADDAHAHLDEAAQLAQRLAERNGMAGLGLRAPGIYVPMTS